MKCLNDLMRKELIIKLVKGGLAVATICYNEDLYYYVSERENCNVFIIYDSNDKIISMIQYENIEITFA